MNFTYIVTMDSNGLTLGFAPNVPKMFSQINHNIDFTTTILVI